MSLTLDGFSFVEVVTSHIIQNFGRAKLQCTTKNSFYQNIQKTIEICVLYPIISNMNEALMSLRRGKVSVVFIYTYINCIFLQFIFYMKDLRIGYECYDS